MRIRHLLLGIVLLLGPACAREEGETAPAGADSAAQATAATDDAGRPLPGRWRELRRWSDRASLTPEQQAEIRRLESIGYVGGSRAPLTDDIVTVYDPGRAWNGLNFFTSGNAPVAYLTDMTGRVLHRWFRDYLDIWPDAEREPAHGNYDFWRRARLLPDGGILAIYEGLGIVRLDRDSQVVWARHDGAHHDLQVQPDGSIYLLTRRAHLVPRVHPTKPILEDFLTILDADGRELRSVSVLECFENSPYAELGLARAEEAGDLMHTNTVRVLPGNRAYPVAWLRPGWILTSLRNPSVLAVLDLDGGTVRHAWQGPFRHQHDPRLVARDHLLLFDNVGPEDHSRVLELDLRTLEPAWEYHGPPEQPLSSWTCGAADRLPNGNTLITETDQGRALEITPSGEVVWEYHNPFRIGEDPVYVASLFELMRLPPDAADGWLR